MNRPTSVTVFGVLNLVFGVWGLLGTAAAAVVYYAVDADFAEAGFEVARGGFIGAWTNIMLVLGAAAACVLLAAGVGLLKMRPWARVASIGYAIYSVVATVAGTAVQWIFVARPMIDQFQAQGGPEAAGATIGAVAGLAGAVLSLIYPLLLWFFMTRPHVVAAFRGLAATQHDAEPFAPVAAQMPFAESSNPYVAPQTESLPAAVAGGSAESIVEAFVPSKNGPALAAYYLGLLALLPCLGFPVGVAAVYFGIKGLRRVRENPEVRGGAHAWAGVICGSLFGLFNFLLLGLMILGGVAAAMGY